MVRSGGLGVPAQLQHTEQPAWPDGQVGSLGEAGRKVSRATGSRMLVSALLAGTRDPAGVERTRWALGAGQGIPPQRQRHQGLQNPEMRSSS